MHIGGESKATSKANHKHAANKNVATLQHNTHSGRSNSKLGERELDKKRFEGIHSMVVTEANNRETSFVKNGHQDHQKEVIYN